MKKRKMIVITVIMMIACMGCGAKEVEIIRPAEDTSVSELQEENDPAESEAEEKNENYSDLEEKGENSETAAFAEKIQAAVADRNMEALADLCFYPVAVNSEVVENKDAFMDLGEEVIFTEERCSVIAAVDVSTLEETMAGVIMGDAAPNIIFKSVDGELGIAGIN